MGYCLLLGLILLGIWIPSAASDCNITVTSDFSWFESPMYPSNYPNNSICNYTFIYSRPQNYRLIVYFYWTDIEDSESCAADSLSIYDGNSTNAPLIDTICGRKSGIQYMTTRNSFFIQFRTNDNVTKRGFKAYFSGQYMNSRYNLSGAGYMDSPNYPYRYPFKESITYSIKTYHGNNLILRMVHFDLESSRNCKKDSLRIYEGSISNASLMSTRCGSDSAHYISQSNLIYLVFTSDSTTSKTGYRFYYTDCNVKVTSLNSQIDSPLYPSNYPNSTICNYTFLYNRPMNYRLYVYFSVFDIEESESCAADSLSIYDGNSSHAPLIDTICGSKSGNRYMTTGNSLFVQFKSNKNVTKQGFRAYFQQQLIYSKYNFSGSGSISANYPYKYPYNEKITYYIRNYHGNKVILQMVQFYLESSRNCKKDSLKMFEGSISNSSLMSTRCDSRNNLSDSGNIDSPNYRYRYPHKESITYSIRNPYGNKIILQMLHFDLQSSPNCTKDSLKIYEGSISNSTLKSTRCGNDMTRYISQSNLIHLVFRSDSTIARTGYRIEYPGCGGSYSDWYQSQILSPDFPNTYPADFICRYELHPRFANHGVRLQFDQFELENSPGCQNDNLTIYKGNISNKDIADIKCGNVSGDFFSNSGLLIMVFKSNSFLNTKGFRIRVTHCSKLLTNESGIIILPKHAYHLPIRCTYAIRLEKGSRVQLIFKNFSSDNCYSCYLYIYDGRDSSARLGMVLRRSDATNYLASGNEVYMVYENYRYRHQYSETKLQYYAYRETSMYRQSKLVATTQIAVHTSEFSTVGHTINPKSSFISSTQRNLPSRSISMESDLRVGVISTQNVLSATPTRSLMSTPSTTTYSNVLLHLNSTIIHSRTSTEGLHGQSSSVMAKALCVLWY